MTNKDGRVLGIFTGAARHDEFASGELSLGVRMTTEIVNWVNGLFH